MNAKRLGTFCTLSALAATFAVGLALPPTASAHDCSTNAPDYRDFCGDCKAGEYHHHSGSNGSCFSSCQEPNGDPCSNGGDPNYAKCQLTVLDFTAFPRGVSTRLSDIMHYTLVVPLPAWVCPGPF